jgi:hypothetical protein
MGTVRRNIGLKEYLYIIFIINIMYTVPTLLYKEYRSSNNNPKDAAAAMYLFVIPIGIFIVTFLYTIFTGEIRKVVIVFAVIYLFSIVMPYVTIQSLIVMGIGYVLIVFLAAVAGNVVYESFGSKVVNKANDLMDKADEKSLEKQKKKMAVKIKEEGKTEGIKDKAMKNIDSKNRKK